MWQDEFEGTDVDAPKDIVITCMDYRVDTSALLRLLGLQSGYVLRNAGGVVSEDVVRSLLLYWFKIVKTPDISISVVTHTYCGMIKPGDDAINAEIEADHRIAQRPPFSLETFPSPELGVRRSIQRLRDSPFLHAVIRIRGLVYDIDPPGALREVKTYVVEGTQTMEFVAEKFGVSLVALREANPQIENDRIGPRQVLIIPLAKS